MIDFLQEEKRVHENIGRAKRDKVPATLTVEEWIANIELFHGLCAYCCQEPFAVLDHLIPTALEGGTTQDNCVPACHTCNSRKSDGYTPQILSADTLLAKVEQVRLALNGVFPLISQSRSARIARVGNRKVGRALTSIYLDEQDRQAIQVIKERYGITSDSDVIRFALRLVAREEGKPYVSGETGTHRQDPPTR